MRPRVPWPLRIAGALATLVIAVPVAALLLKAPWGRVADLADPSVGSAVMLSVWTSFVAGALALFGGTGIGWLIHRCEFRGRALLRAVVLAPLVLPPVVGGIALLAAFGHRGLIPLGLTFTPAAVVLAQVFVSLPFVVLAVEAGLDRIPRDVEDTASTLGADPWTQARRVTLPLMRPTLLGAATVAWARSVGEFGATLAFAGNIPGRTRTLPLAAYTALQSDPSLAVLLGCVLLGVAVTTVAVVWVRMGATQSSQQRR